MLRNREEEKNIDMDERQNPLMTLRTLKYYCQKEGLFATPEHNDKLYLQFKGFRDISPETLSQYHNLVALWLDHNSISQIKGLNRLIGLTSLALNNNFISKIEGLENLINLSILNLSHNKIEVVEGLSSLRKLETLNLSHNFITLPEALVGICCCEGLSSLDLSHNELELSERTFEEIVRNKELGCLYLKATPLAKGFKNYRKKFIASLKKLRFLDDRPVIEQDHRLSEAWVSGGPEMQNLEKIKIAEEKKEKQLRQKQQKASAPREQTQPRSKPVGFIASVKDTSIRIMNIEDKAEEERIIDQYFQAQKQEIEKNIKREKQRLEREKRSSVEQSEVIAERVKQILWQNRDSQKSERIEKAIQEKWKPKYEPILETLLLRYKFDFGEVQPSFNMIVANVNRRLLKAPVRFQIEELRRIWTRIELRKREGKP